MNSITIVRTDSENPGLSSLINQLDEELCQIYSTNAADFEEYNRITGLDTVVLAYINDEPVACGCFKQIDKATIELRRMFVVHEFRGKGIASLLVGELEKWGKELGNQSSYLETGTRQPGAVALYQKLGYKIVDQGITENNICMYKTL